MALDEQSQRNRTYRQASPSRRHAIGVREGTLVPRVMQLS